MIMPEQPVTRSIPFFTPPEESIKLRAAIQRIRELSATNYLYMGGIAACAKTIAALAIIAFDCVAYTGRAIGDFTVCIITLDFKQAFIDLYNGICNVLNSLKMAAYLTFCAVIGLFAPCAFTSLISKEAEIQLDLSKIALKKASLEADIENLNKERDQIIEKIAELEQEQASINLNATAALKEEIEQLNLKKEEIENEINDGETDHQELLESIERVNIELAELEKNKNKIKKEQDGLQKQLEAVKISNKDSEMRADALNKEQGDLLKTINALKLEQNNLDKAVAALNEQEAKLQHEEKESRKNIEELINERQELTKEIEKHTIERGVLEEEILQGGNRIKAQEAALLNLQKRIDNARLQSEKLTADLEERNKEITAARNTITQLDTQRKTHTDAVSNTEKRVKEQDNLILQNNRLIDGLEARKNALINECKTLNAQIEAQKQDQNILQHVSEKLDSIPDLVQQINSTPSKDQVTQSPSKERVPRSPSKHHNHASKEKIQTPDFSRSSSNKNTPNREDTGVKDSHEKTQLTVNVSKEQAKKLYKAAQERALEKKESSERLTSSNIF